MRLFFPLSLTPSSRHFVMATSRQRFAEGDVAIVTATGEKVTVLNFERNDLGLCLYKCINILTGSTALFNSIQLRHPTPSTSTEPPTSQPTSQRFIAMSGEELDALASKSTSIATKASTKWGVGIFRGKLKLVLFIFNNLDETSARADIGSKVKINIHI